MAYPTVSKPYGLQPINLIGGQVYAGSTRLFRIAANYNTSIYYGDLVKLNTDGTIVKDTGTTTATPVGIFLGCTYTNPSTSQKLNYQSYTANTNAQDIQAYVVDDPDVLFKVAAVSATTTVAFYSSQQIGLNAALVQNNGSNTTGDSQVAIDGTSFSTLQSLPIRVVDIVPDTSNSANGYCEFICKFNAPYIVSTFTNVSNVVTSTVTGGHAYLNPVGV